MHTSKRFALLAAAMFITLGTAQADDHIGDGYIDGMLSAQLADRDRLVDDGLNGGTVRIGKAFDDRWNLELALSGLKMDGDKSKGGTDINQFAVGGNALAVFNRGGQFQPYILTGLGMAQSRYQNASNDNNYYIDLGLGAIVPIWDGKSRLRGEILYRSDNDIIDSKDWILNIGFGTPFGSKSSPPRKAEPAPAPAPRDSDGDGVYDDRDQCPGTPAGAAVDARGCELDSDGDGVVDSKDQCPGTPAGTEVDAVGCPVVTVINLEGVKFRTNSADLRDGADAILDAQAATLVANPDVSIEVAGHTDADGDAGYNQGLSQRRAEAVRSYLIGKGVNADRITAKGYGEAEPIADNVTRDGKAANRRVELRIREN